MAAESQSRRLTPSLPPSLLELVLVLLQREMTREAPELKLDMLAVEADAKEGQETDAVAVVGVEVDVQEC